MQRQCNCSGCACAGVSYYRLASGCATRRISVHQRVQIHGFGHGDHVSMITNDQYGLTNDCRDERCCSERFESTRQGCSTPYRRTRECPPPSVLHSPSSKCTRLFSLPPAQRPSRSHSRSGVHVHRRSGAERDCHKGLQSQDCLARSRLNDVLASIANPLSTGPFSRCAASGPMVAWISRRRRDREGVCLLSRNDGWWPARACGGRLIFDMGALARSHGSPEVGS